MYLSMSICKRLLASVHPESGNFGVTAFKKNDDFPKS
jgi:hypothetical protein